MFHSATAMAEAEQILQRSAAPTENRCQHGFKTTKLFGFDLVNSTRAVIAAALIQRALGGHRTRVSFINAHCANVALGHPAYAEILRESDMLLPDGSGMRIASKLAGLPFGDNLNGTDLFPDLCARAADSGVPIFLLGGEPGVAEDAAREMQHRYPTLKVVGAQVGPTHHVERRHVDRDPAHRGKPLQDHYFMPAEIGGIIDSINASGAGMLFVGFGVPRQERWIDRYADQLNVPVLLGVGGLFDYYSGRIPRAPLAIRRIGCEWVWRMAQEPRRLANRYLVGNAVFLANALAHAVGVRLPLAEIGAGVKRAGDLVATTMAMLFAWPLFLLIAAAIKLEDRGAVFFRQTRVGVSGRPFEMLKFRSMVVDAEQRRAALLNQSERDSVCFKMRKDPRITRVGAILRRLSLDELPQLLNVLGGSMSLVGPRPALPQEVIRYRGRSWRRLHGKPGITCTWQVSGRAEIPFEDQVEMDIEYVEQRSVFTDFILLARTLPAVLSARGAY